MIWSPLAIERAYEEARFIADDKPDAALRWLDGLFESTDRLQRFPLAGRVVPEIEHPDYRGVIYRKHRGIYRVEKRRVSILTVRRRVNSCVNPRSSTRISREHGFRSSLERSS